MNQLAHQSSPVSPRGIPSLKLPKVRLKNSMFIKKIPIRAKPRTTSSASMRWLAPIGANSACAAGFGARSDGACIYVSVSRVQHAYIVCAAEAQCSRCSVDESGLRRAARPAIADEMRNSSHQRLYRAPQLGDRNCVELVSGCALGDAWWRRVVMPHGQVLSRLLEHPCQHPNARRPSMRLTRRPE